MSKGGRWMVATGILLGAALAVQAGAPSATQQPKQPVMVQKPPVLALAPDLACTLAVFEDAAGTKALPPGGSVMSGGGTVWVFARLTVQNLSTVAKADNVAAKLTSSSGTPTNVTLPPVNLAAGATHAYPLQKITYGAISSQVTLTGTVDPANAIKESNEGNNTCSFNFSEQTVH